MDMLFFDHLDKLVRIAITATMVYILIILLTKISGKRSTSQLNNFDWVMTVMIGSLGASIVLLREIPFIEGATALITLYVLQFLVTKYSAISQPFARLILSEPRIVFYEGQFLPEAMRAERLTRQELESAMRSEGIHNLEDVEAIIFESDAKLAIIPKSDPPKEGISETLKPIIR